MDQQTKVAQVTDLAASTLTVAMDLREKDKRAAANAASASRVYVTLADMLRQGTPRRCWVAPALRTADMHNAQAGIEPCADLVLALLYGRA
jgi:hypothetical protein